MVNDHATDEQDKEKTARVKENAPVADLHPD